MTRHRLLALLIFFMTGIASCVAVQPARTCDEIRGQKLRGLMQQRGSPDEVRQRIAQLFGLEPGQITYYPDNSRGGFEWAKGEILGSLTTEQFVPVAASLNYRSGAPYAGMVIRCLGRPERYRAWYHLGPSGQTLEFDLYFPAQGIRASVEESGRGNDPPRPNDNTPMIYFFYVQIGSTEETMARLGEGLSPELRKQIKPWPDKWEDIVIDIGPVQ